MIQVNSITNKHQERRKNTREDFIREMDRKALKTIMESEDGRWFIMRLLDKTFVHRTTFTGDNTSFYNEGRRSVGVELIQDIGILGKKGVELKHKAELEYVERQEKFATLEMANDSKYERR